MKTTTPIAQSTTTTAPITVNVVQPYLFFDGRCEEALAFYVHALGAEVTCLMRFSDNPEQNSNPCTANVPANKIMHASFRLGSTEIFASDGMATGQAKFDGFSLSLNVPDTETAERAFAALSDGGQVTMPLAATFFSPRFGMVCDRFRVKWMVIVPAAQ